MGIASVLYKVRSVIKNKGLSYLIMVVIFFVSKYTKDSLGKAGLYHLDSYLQFLIWWNSGCGKYEALANPFKIIEIDPDSVEFVTGRDPYPGRFLWQDIGRVSRGDWDQNNQEFPDLPVVRAINHRYRDGMDWSEVEESVECIEIDNSFKSKVESLHESIQKHGYMRREELRENRDKFEYTEPDYGNAGNKFQKYNEVAVDVGRDGQFLFVDGRHRLAIAKTLKIESISVRISARHKIWQQTREDIASRNQTNGFPDHKHYPVDHPDLKDLKSVLPNRSESWC